MFIQVWHSQGTREIFWIRHSTTTCNALRKTPRETAQGRRGLKLLLRKEMCSVILYFLYTTPDNMIERLLKLSIIIFLNPHILEILIYKINRHACIMSIGYRKDNLNAFVLMSMNSFI